MMVASNTGPLIALSKVDQLGLLKQMFDNIHIPPAVHRELLAKTGSEGERIDRALNEYIQTASTPPIPEELQLISPGLDLGEKQAVALAYELQALLIIDDHAGRVAASKLNIPITGVIGLLLQAKEKQLISVVKPLINQIRQREYWLSDKLVAETIKLARED